MRTVSLYSKILCLSSLHDFRDQLPYIVLTFGELCHKTWVNIFSIPIFHFPNIMNCKNWNTEIEKWQKLMESVKTIFEDYLPMVIKPLLSPIETWYSNTIYIIDWKLKFVVNKTIRLLLVFWHGCHQCYFSYPTSSNWILKADGHHLCWC